MINTDLEEKRERIRMIKYSYYPFQFGSLKIGYEDNVIISLDKVEATEEIGKRTILTDKVHNQIMEYLQGKRKEFDFPYELKGTEFQKIVWKELCKIPYGETRSYKDVAIAIGKPKASRAVGMANNKNPIIIAVPCHRVIGSNGQLVDMELVLK